MTAGLPGHAWSEAALNDADAHLAALPPAGAVAGERAAEIEAWAAEQARRLAAAADAGVTGAALDWEATAARRLRAAADLARERVDEARARAERDRKIAALPPHSPLRRAAVASGGRVAGPA